MMMVTCRLHKNYSYLISLTERKAKTMKACFILIITVSFVMQTNCSAQSNSYSSLANKFLSSLSASQHTKALYDFGNDERYNWHFIPKKDRKGILLSELSEKQKDA